MYTGMLPCLVPSWPQSMQLRTLFQTRSDLVLDADHALDFLSDLSFSGVYLVSIVFFFRQNDACMFFALFRLKMALLTHTHTYIYIYMWVVPAGSMWQFWLPEKITENVVRNGVHRYKMLYFLGTLQEPTVNTVKTRFLWVCDVPSQTVMAASKHCKTSCFRCLTLKNPKIATWTLKVPHIYIYTYIYIYINYHRIGEINLNQ